MIKPIRLINQRHQEEKLKKRLEHAIRNNEPQSVQEIIQSPCFINLNKGFSRGHLSSTHKKISYLQRVFFGIEAEEYKSKSRSALGLALNVQPNLAIIRMLLNARNANGRVLNLNIADGFGETDLSRIVSSKIPFEKKQQLINELLDADDVHADQQPVTKMLRQMICVSKQNIDFISIKHLLNFVKHTPTFDCNFDLKWRSSSPQTPLDWFIYLHQSTQNGIEKNEMEQIIGLLQELGGLPHVAIPIKSTIETVCTKKSSSKIINYFTIRINQINEKCQHIKLYNYLHTLPDSNIIGQLTRESYGKSIRVREKLLHTWQEIIHPVRKAEHNRKNEKQ